MRTRLDVERMFLQEKFPGFKIQDPFGPNPGVLGSMQTNAGNTYVIWLALGDFPNVAPRMYIIAPKHLSTYSGQLLASIGASSEMHLLGPDDHGHPQICHYNGVFWHPKVSLSNVLMKGRLWLEAYEEHLRQGSPIDTYLPHME